MFIFSLSVCQVTSSRAGRTCIGGSRMQGEDRSESRAGLRSVDELFL